MVRNRRLVASVGSFSLTSGKFVTCSLIRPLAHHSYIPQAPRELASVPGEKCRVTFLRVELGIERGLIYHTIYRILEQLLQFVGRDFFDSKRRARARS